MDAFVALGGEPTKEGYISKNTLIAIIKTEFELTIDMEVKKQQQQLTHFVGIFEEGWWRYRSHKLLSVLCDA